MKRLRILGLATLLVIAFGCSGKEPAPSGAFDAGFARFNDALGKGDFTAALAALRSSFEAFREKSPLLLQNVKFVTSESASYGIYEPRASDEFAAGDVIYLYLEPVGQVLKESKDGRHEFGFSADFSLENAAGKVLGGQKDFASPRFSSWNFNTEIALTFNFSFSGLQAGRYKILLTVRDAHSAKSASVEKSFAMI
jgi:hypothetical protein